MKINIQRQVIADTSIWINFLKNDPDIFQEMQLLLEKNIIISAECIFGELLQGAKTKRERDIIKDYWHCLPKLEEKGIWIEAGVYSGENKLFDRGIGLIDSVIIIAAIRNDLLVWSLDKKLNKVLDGNQRYR